MGAEQFFYLVIILALGLSVILMFPRFFKITGKMILNATVGLGIIFTMNALIPGDTYHIGLNIITGGVTGLLGIPGVLLLYAVKVMF